MLARNLPPTGQVDRHFGREREPCGCGQARMLAGVRFVIRDDHRDTGRWVTYPPGRPGYSVAGAAGVLDAHGVPAAPADGVLAGRVLVPRLAPATRPRPLARPHQHSPATCGDRHRAFPPATEEFARFVTATNAD